MHVGGRARATALKKLCNHPKLIYDMLASSTEGAADGFKDCAQFFAPVRAARTAAECCQMSHARPMTC